jgi:hypothetical protein
MPLSKPMIAVLLVTGTAVAGCSSSTTGRAADATPPSHSTLQSIVLQSNDLPAGWTGQAAPAESSDSAVEAQVMNCVGGTQPNAANKIEEVDSDEFDQGNNSISSSASSYKNHTELQHRLALFLNPKADACFSTALNTELKKSLPSGAQLGEVSFHITKGPAGHASNVVAVGSGKVTVTLEGQTVPIYLDETLIEGALLGASIQFTGLGARIDLGVQSAAIAAVAKRVAAAD